MLSTTGVSWATIVVPDVCSPPDAPEWWNVECEQYAYAWWEDDIEPTPGVPVSLLTVSPPADPTHWATNFLKSNTEFTASAVGDVVTINLINEYRKDLYKEIYIYLRGTTISTTNGILYDLDTDDGIFEGKQSLNIGGGLWFFEVEGEIHPQPGYVKLTVTVPGLESVTDIWAGENCLPEPATIAILGLGGLFLRRKRRA